MAERDFTRLTPDEKINGIKASKLPDHIRSKYHGEDVRETLAQLAEMTMQLGVNMGLSPEDALKMVKKLQDLDSQVNNLIANAGDTDGNAELLDIRVGWDGRVHPNAGNAVRDGMNTFFEIGKNLFNKDDILPNKTMSATTGAITDSEAHYLSHKFYTNAGETFVTNIPSGNDFIIVYYVDTNDNVISYHNTTNDSNVFTTPPGTSYFRFRGGMAYLNKTQVESGSDIHDYEPYGLIKISRIPNNSISRDKVDFIIVNKKEGTFEELGEVNSTVHLNKEINLRTGTLEDSEHYITFEINNLENVDAIFSEWLTSSSGETTTHYPMVFFDSKGSLLKVFRQGTLINESIGGRAGINVELPIDTSKAYVSTSTTNYNFDRTRLYLQNYRYELNGVVASSGTPQEVKSPFEGMSLAVTGDSIMARTYFSNELQKRLGFEDVTNYAIGGTAYTVRPAPYDTNAISVRYTEMADNHDVIAVWAGTNDFSSAVGLGNMTDRETDTFYGALHTTFNGLVEKYPTKKLVVLTMPPRYNKVNSKGETVFQYADAIREVAAYYAIPSLDILRNSQLRPWNEANKTAYISDGLHPNAPEGYDLILPRIVEFLKTI